MNIQFYGKHFRIEEKSNIFYFREIEGNEFPLEQRRTCSKDFLLSFKQSKKHLQRLSSFIYMLQRTPSVVMTYYRKSIIKKNILEKIFRDIRTQGVVEFVVTLDRK